MSLVAVMVLTVIFFRSRPSKSHPDQRSTIFVIGLDGASWNLMNPLLAEDKLPNIKRLMARGAYGPL